MLTRTFITGLLSLTVITATSADTLVGRVVGIADGDTLTVLDATNTQYRIRLTGIDAPEKSQPYGQHCKKSLSDLAYGKEVRVEWFKLDKYRRTLGKVLVDGQDANLEQLRRGCAWHYKKYQAEQSPLDRAQYSNAEIEARQAGRGLWTDPAPMPPWEWRHRR